ncbi:hypothetical protein BCR42DRAFT_399166 [Absidia repens]|uniref:Uncharacterized protein n=1 Tax=Absidia repens TaxID=90262 RepID=A0A1X2HDZ0_9FUNG|nr:hypothetical protein BCR42DRAFT_399166 [Absidia repens]
MNLYCIHIFLCEKQPCILYDLMTTHDRYDICINGCRLFKDDVDISCSTCNVHRYDRNLQSKRTISMLPLEQQLGLLFYNPGTRKDLLYRANYKQQQDYDSIFSGKHYQSKKHALFTSPYDLAVGLYVDGFKSTLKSSYPLTMVNIVVSTTIRRLGNKTKKKWNHSINGHY